MDFVTHLPSSHGKTVIWVVVDRFSKYAHFLPLPPKFTAASIAPIFIAEIYKLHGMPKSIVSDRDKVFTSRFWKELFKISGTSHVTGVDELVSQRQSMLNIIKENLTKAQLRLRSQADSHRQERIFMEGEWVWLKLQPYRQSSPRDQTSPKLAKRFFGPYQIKRVIGTITYELMLPPESRVHPVFHVSKLKPFHGSPPLNTPPLDTTVTETMVQLQPSQVLGRRTIHSLIGHITQLLAQWVGLPALEATWEDYTTLVQNYPNLNLEDKVLSDGVGNDTNMQGPISTIGPNDSEPQSTRGKRVRKEPKWLEEYSRK
ncbi:uncharacterized protein LOC127122406 [Lathyrus oleraceus]|uniref:uncharacterized protein LOC127122406 n=1 Tax=Pisum sativum TaxID=3888 RepID=UPI0021CF1584|nr:uncharacterized protein LOC127122406 [Pisum sativum]